MARRLGISRNNVRQRLLDGITEPVYLARQTQSSLDKFADKLSAWLKTESTKSCMQRRTLKRIPEELRELGFEGSYECVAVFA